MSIALYVRWQDGEMWLGFFEQFPDYLTQGESLSELEENLRDLNRDLTSGEIPGIRSIAELAVECSGLISSASSKEAGGLLIRHGGRHDWYQIPRTGASRPVPRHREMKDFLARHIPRRLAAGPE